MANTQTATAGYRSVEALSALVGMTPMLEIHYRYNGTPRRIYAKYEVLNMTGSIKDRMMLHIIRRGYESGSLHPGDIIVEATSGNTGISAAAIGSALGHPVRIYMPDWMSQERMDLIAAFGAEIVLVSHEEGGFIGSIEAADSFAAQSENSFLPHQFAHAANVEAHFNGTGPEIELQLFSLGRAADAFVAGVGTGGTVMGVGHYLQQSNPEVQIHPLEPANSPTLRTGSKLGEHRIQGISDEFIPPIVHLDELDDIVDVWDGDAILMAQAMCRELGLPVGISAGANVLGAMKIAESLGDGATVVTVLPDSNKKYLSTDLCREEPIRDDYLTPLVTLDGFNSFR